MKFIMKVRMSLERGNDAMRNPQFGLRMQQLLSEIKAEATYFSVINGQRGAYIIINLNDPSEMPAVAEPFWYWLNADIEFYPVLSLEDLAKAGDSIGGIVQKWGAL